MLGSDVSARRRSPSARATVRRERHPAGRQWQWSVTAVAALAFTVRLVPMLHGGGLVSSDGYDDSVYYAAATALAHGRMPYADYVLLHPPGLVLALTPFAELARLTSDSVGQAVARLAFMLLGALNTVMVMAIGRRFATRAGVAAGLLYALSFPALYSERTTTLEALGSTTLLAALALLLAHRRWPAPSATGERISTGRLVAAGAALGAGAGVKIWGVVPLAVVALWATVRLGRRAGAVLSAAALAAVSAICLPFFARAPAPMLRLVVGDQLGRPGNAPSPLRRLSLMAGLQMVLPHASAQMSHLALAAVLTLVTVAATAAIGTALGQLLVALLAAETVLLLASPSFYVHYTTLTAAPAALVLGIGVQRGGQWATRRLPRRPVRAASVLTALALAAYALPGVAEPQGKHFPRRFATVAAAVPGCITADDPAYLIGMNVLSRDLDHGCPVWVDVAGLTFDRAGGGGDGRRIDRRTNQVWQQMVTGYLLSGAATMAARKATDLDRQSAATISRLPVLARSRDFTLRRVR